MKKYLLLMFAAGVILSGCNQDEVYEEEDVLIEDSADEEEDYDFSEETENYYSEEELESDPSAPSTDPDDYNSSGEYVPQDGPSSNPADYNSKGEYKPVEDMTQEEIQQELMEMFGD